MRALILCLAMTCGGAALADDLADANAALLAKSYPVALQTFTKLAKSGNPEAQLRLGEMYWYGEGVAMDRAKGDALFAQSAASGNKEAAAAQTLSARRAQRSAEIAYWTGGYDGADLSAGKLNCVAPALPAVSITNVEIKATGEAITKWQSCYQAFAANLADAQPAGKRIPAEVAVVMSEQETQQAVAHLNKVYGAVIEKAKADALAFTERREKWQAATMAAVDQQNRITEARTKQIEAERAAETRSRMIPLNQIGGPAPKK